MMTPRNSENGFSLIEVMISVFVLAIAGITIVNLMQATTRNTIQVRERALAMLAAENILNAQLLDPDHIEADHGEYTLGGEVFDWEITLVGTEDPSLTRLELDVVRSGETSRLARLHTYRMRRE